MADVVIGWATCWHENCFEKSQQHGRWLLALMRDRPDSEHLYDHSGSIVSLVDSESEDCRDETGMPMSCDYCLGYLVPDEAARESILGRDIMNLSELYRNESITRLLAECRHIALRADTQPHTLRHLMVTALAKANVGNEQGLFLEVGTKVLDLTHAWIEKWRNREVIQLQQDENGLYRMARGVVGWDVERHEAILSDTPNEREDWTEYDMRGYLDQIDDGQSACSSCGCQVSSHAYYAEWDSSEVYCPDCVTVE